jgi:hypothetical protein
MNSVFVCAVISVENVVVSFLIVILKVNKCFCVLIRAVCFTEPVCDEKLKTQLRNTDLILQTLYLCLDNKIFVNKTCV